MTHLRLVADDLTGALDATAQFVSPGRAIPVFFSGAFPSAPPADFGVDAVTRDLDRDSAAAAASRFASVLEPAAGVTSFKKVDSQLRGHSGVELAATIQSVRVRFCIVAPAFPFHQRVTRGGLQFHLRDGKGHQVGEHLHATLRSKGVDSVHARPGDPVPEGVSLWDAETDEDLRRIVEAGRALSEPMLWCGSGGLAAALGSGSVAMTAKLGRPILGVFGSDQPATAAQLAACGEGIVKSLEGGAPIAEQVSARLGADGVCLVGFDVPVGTDRTEAAALIETEIAEHVCNFPKPRTLIASGGETLRALCMALGAEYLSVIGQVIPGVPVSVLTGGRWDGVRVISKSGAFGDENLLRRLLAG